MNSQGEGDDIPQAIKNTCGVLTGALGSSGVDTSFSGSTGVFVVVTDTTLYLGNVGDSRAAVMSLNPGTCCSAEKMTGAPLTDDHKPESPSEQVRIRSCGGHCVQMGPIMRVVEQT